MDIDYLVDIKVKDALKKDVLLIPEDESIESLNEVMLIKKQEEVIVVDAKGKVSGIITSNDLAKSLARGIDLKTPVKNIMSKNVISMAPEKSLTEAKKEMRNYGIGRAPVFDEKGNILGLLTKKSICDAFSSQLEKAVSFQKLILENLNAAICILDNSCQIISYNKAFEKLFKPYKFLQFSPHQFLPEQLIDKIKKGERPLDKIHFENKEGRNFSLKTVPFEFDNKLRGIILHIEEISDVINMIAQLDKINRKMFFMEKQLNKSNNGRPSLGSLTSKNPEMINAIELAKRAASTDDPVLIKGERGTGKQMLAVAIHENSDRKSFPFIRVNCSAIPSNIFERELFGVEKSTSGENPECVKVGLLELADKGTIFFDGIDSLPHEIQIKLNKFMEEKQFYKFGGKYPLRVDVRIIASTDKQLDILAEKEEFSIDLYRKINVVAIEIPPLRKRTEDILDLAAAFSAQYQQRYNKRIDNVDSQVLKIFLDYRWPGNVRELKNVVERMIVLSQDNKIKWDDLPKHMKQLNDEHVFLTDDIDDLNSAADIAEKHVIIEALKRCSYNKTKTAEFLKISRSTLYNKLKEYGIE